MSAPAPDSYDDFLQRIALETSLLEASASNAVRAAGRLTYQAWSLAVPEHARRASSQEDAWQAGATAMFQALVERGYVAPHEVERALASTLDVLTT